MSKSARLYRTGIHTHQNCGFGLSAQLSHTHTPCACAWPYMLLYERIMLPVWCRTSMPLQNTAKHTHKTKERKRRRATAKKKKYERTSQKAAAISSRTTVISSTFCSYWFLSLSPSPSVSIKRYAQYENEWRLMGKKKVFGSPVDFVHLSEQYRKKNHITNVRVRYKMYTFIRVSFVDYKLERFFLCVCFWKRQST